MKRFLCVLLSFAIFLSLIAVIPLTAHATETSAESFRSATGWIKQNGKWYYIMANGQKATGWQFLGGVWYYFTKAGEMYTGWLNQNGIMYYMESSGKMVTGWKLINNKWYYFKSNGGSATGWQKIGGVWYYFNASGVMATGWQKIGGTWYYLKSSGAMATGWLRWGSKWYYLQSSGAMTTGRFDMGELPDHGWYEAYKTLIEEDAQKSYESAKYKFLYIDDDSIPELIFEWLKKEDGDTVTGIRIASYRNGKLTTHESIHVSIMNRIKSFRYTPYSGVYHISSGFMGYYYDNVYLLKNGEFTTLGNGKTEDNGNTYTWNGNPISENAYNSQLQSYASVNAYAISAQPANEFRTVLWSTYETWLNEYELYYDFGTDGIMATGWRQTDGKWYYFGADGMVETGWVTIGDYKYYFDTHGVMQTGWLYRDGNRYYLRSSGAMATGSVTLGGKTYYFGTDGICQNP